VQFFDIDLNTYLFFDDIFPSWDHELVCSSHTENAFGSLFYEGCHRSAYFSCRNTMPD